MYKLLAVRKVRYHSHLIRYHVPRKVGTLYFWRVVVCTYYIRSDYHEFIFRHAKERKACH